MGISPSTRANVTFAVAIVLLFVSGAGAFFTIAKLHSNQYWVSHTYEVEVALGDIESSLASVGRARIAYVGGGTQKELADFQAAVQHVSVSLTSVRRLTSDNPTQRGLYDRLAANASSLASLPRPPTSCTPPPFAASVTAGMPAKLTGLV